MFHNRFALALLSGVALWAGAAFAQPPASMPASQPAPEAREASWNPLTSGQLTGDWGGARTWLAEQGLEITLSLTTIYQHNAHGGANTHKAHDVTGSSDLEISADLGAMKLVPGGRLYMLGESSWGRGIDGDVGGIFSTNTDGAGDRPFDVAELWYEQSFLGEALRIRLGKIDVTTDFDTNAFANDETAQFLNSALVNTGNVPFPDRGLGLQVMVQPCDWFYFGAAVIDAHADVRETGFNTSFHGPDDFFSVYELGLTPELETAWGTLPGSYRFGLWYDPQTKEQFFNDLGGRIRTVPHRSDDLGFYLSFDQLVFREVADPADTQGLGLFCRYGYARGDVNLVEHFWSVGGQYQGLLPTRDDDVLAFGAAHGAVSDNLELTRVHAGKETVLELYYNARVLPWLTVTPDFQWILEPGESGGRDAFVAGLRLQASF